jgi:hypothetical protein
VTDDGQANEDDDDDDDDDSDDSDDVLRVQRRLLSSISRLTFCPCRDFK